MNPSLIIVDDFAPNPQQVRLLALGSDFGTYPFQGVMYKGVGGSNQPNLEKEIARALGPVKLVLSFFRLGTPGNDPTTYIHADRNCAEWAGVLYLSRPQDCRGGTAFWTHPEHGDRVPAQADWTRLNSEGADESLWKMNGLAGMKFNRFVAYRSDLFHSRYPKEAWGTGPTDGRLIWTCFFNRMP